MTTRTSYRPTGTMREAMTTIAAEPAAPGVKDTTLDALERHGLIRFEQEQDVNGYAVTFPRYYVTELGRTFLPAPDPEPETEESEGRFVQYGLAPESCRCAAGAWLVKPHTCTEGRTDAPAFPLFTFSAREWWAVSTVYRAEERVWRTQVVRMIGCQWRDVGEPTDAASAEQARRDHAAELAALKPTRRRR